MTDLRIRALQSGFILKTFLIFSSLFSLNYFLLHDFRSPSKPHQKSPMSKRSRSPPPPSSMPLSPSNPSLLPGNLRPSQVASESPRVSPEAEKDLKEEKEVKTEAYEEAEQENKEQGESPAKVAAEISTPKAKESNG